MTRRMLGGALIAALMTCAAWVAQWDFRGAPRAAHAQSTEAMVREPDVVFVPTPMRVVKRMLELAELKRGDVLYDLGCGDGRIVIAAAKQYGVRAYGFDIDPKRVRDAKENVRSYGVEDLVTIQQRDIFELDLSRADVVTLYLLPELNVKLIPQLKQLRQGARVVSHDFDMEGVTPEKTETLRKGLEREHDVYMWRAPIHVQTALR